MCVSEASFTLLVLLSPFSASTSKALYGSSYSSPCLVFHAGSGQNLARRVQTTKVPRETAAISPRITITLSEFSVTAKAIVQRPAQVDEPPIGPEHSGVPAPRVVASELWALLDSLRIIARYPTASCSAGDLR
eukprot:scaffold1638_cov258-Pinguiococcus_pyrenoidosus.AAC.64